MDDLAACYLEHRDGLTRFAATIVGPGDAEDVVSAAAVEVVRRGTDGIENLPAYLYRCVANAGYKHWRRTWLRRRRERQFAGALAVTDPDDLELLHVLSHLSPQQRAVTHLTYWQDKPPADIAEILGVSEGTVRRQLARARSKLAEVLDDQRTRRDHTTARTDRR